MMVNQSGSACHESTIQIELVVITHPKTVDSIYHTYTTTYTLEYAIDLSKRACSHDS